MDTSDLLRIKELLEQKYRYYNTLAFIENDPIFIPHHFSKKEDIEIAGFFAATIAWGNRKAIIKSGLKLLEMMDNDPHNFILNHSSADLKPFKNFVHRTFNESDCIYFISALKNIYANHQGLEFAFKTKGNNKVGLIDRIMNFRKVFFELPHLKHAEKHISDPSKNSSAKRLCMYLRWMVRQDESSVDFGLWETIKAADLYLPVDVHTGNVSRRLGILLRKSNDWKAVEEVTSILRQFDPVDPVKYDFALFGLGIDGVFKQ
jgi:uncharacterized protein (TIGR02757 family)